MAQIESTSPYFTYFPGNYRWSADVLAVLGTAAYGGPEISEVDRIGRELRGRVGDDEAWFSVWRKNGDILYGRAQQAEDTAHRFTAASNYLRACALYQIADHFRHPKDEQADVVFRRSVECFHRHAMLADRPRIEIVEIPCENGFLPAYFVHAENTTARRNPCVVRFPGFDSNKELNYLRGVPELVRRGYSALVVDAPGSGEAIRYRGFHLRHDYEVAGSAMVDYLLTRSDVDPERIGVMSLSLGGYFAPRCAAFDSRFKVCIAWGAIWDYHEVWKRRIERLRKASLSVPADHLLWAFGVNSFDEAMTKLEGFRLDGVAQKLRCPFLLTHGTDDEQVSLKDAQTLFDAVGSADKTFRIFTREEGGAQHCQRDYLSLACSTMFDWLEDKL